MAMTNARSCGVLLHPTCLTGRFGAGDLGPGAERYLAWLAEAGVSWWQILPLNPPGAGHSPYAATSSFAGNPHLISPDRLAEDGLLTAADLADVPPFPDFTIDFEHVVPYRDNLLRLAWSRMQSHPPAGTEMAFAVFREQASEWLRDFSLFSSIRSHLAGAPWWLWPVELRDRDERALAAWRAAHREDVLFFEFCQFLFAGQWLALRRHARSLGVRILGDVPIFVAGDSADVWANRDLFLLDERGLPTVIAGVPPDYFSATGQLWGNPLYDWQRHEATGFAWWIARLGSALGRVDAVRLDHFRGFVANWEVPAGETTAVRGRWVPGPGRALFDAVTRALGGCPFIAEDLGTITPDVLALRDGLGLPGMAVLQFAFQPAPRSTFLPCRHRENLVVYTGTHDNNTSLGWYLQDASEVEREFLRRYLATDAREVHWDMIRAALGSVAGLAVVTHQDIAGLGADCRMNTPSVASGNWRFRITDWMLGDSLRDRLAGMIDTYGRTPAPPGR